MNPANHEPRPGHQWACAEIALIVLLFFVLAGTPPPDVNEAHYLAKAKHYWNPSWCARDFFLNSADAHVVFYWIFGWVTLWLPLTAVAWVGRFVTWGLLAWAWRRLSVAVVPGKLYSVLSAGLFAVLVADGHMSGEWIIGGVEAKGFSYVLVLLALESLVRGRWRTALICNGIATALHVIVGGWSLVATGIAWMMTSSSARPSLRVLWPSLLAAGVATLPGLIPALLLTWSADPETVRAANLIYVFERLSHHLVFHALPRLYVARHVTLIVIWLGLIRWLSLSPQVRTLTNRLNSFVAGAVLIAVAGAVIDQLLLLHPTLAASLLRYYWFRLTDVMIPLALAIHVAARLEQLSKSQSRNYPMVLLATLLVVGGGVCWTMVEHARDPRPGAVVQSFIAPELTRAEKLQRFREWQLACDWIRENTRPNDAFLTPRNQQTFKWYAERNEVICGKDVPQDAAGIIEWSRRRDEILPWSLFVGEVSLNSEGRLAEIAQTYQFQYIVVDCTLGQSPVFSKRLYPQDSSTATYEVYRAPSRHP